jgi:hypothetical protein
VLVDQAPIRGHGSPSGAGGRCGRVPTAL